jgi:hypothetical protein
VLAYEGSGEGFLRSREVARLAGEEDFVSNVCIDADLTGR